MLYGIDLLAVQWRLLVLEYRVVRIIVNIICTGAADDIVSARHRVSKIAAEDGVGSAAAVDVVVSAAAVEFVVA